MDRSHDWLNQAESDLRAAKDLLDSGNYAWSCFLGQKLQKKHLKRLEKNLILLYGVMILWIW